MTNRITQLEKKIKNLAFPKKKKQLPIAVYEGKDYWGRDTYKLENSLQHLRMVDGVLHTSTISGEPSSPVKTKLKLIKKKRNYGSGVAFNCTICGEQIESWRYAPFCKKHWRTHRYD